MITTPHSAARRWWHHRAGKRSRLHHHHVAAGGRHDDDRAEPEARSRRDHGSVAAAPASAVASDGRVNDRGAIQAQRTPAGRRAKADSIDSAFVEVLGVIGGDPKRRPRILRPFARLFNDVAVRAPSRQVRDVMLELRYAMPTPHGSKSTKPALRSLRAMAGQMESDRTLYGARRVLYRRRRGGRPTARA